MSRLRGVGLGTGMALGTAALVRVRGGVPLMPEIPPRIAALVAQRRLSETPEVVIVADEYRTAAAISSTLTWAKVVGIASEQPAGDASVPSIPAVAGIAGLIQATMDDMLILVDAVRGLVLVDPDPIYLAQYTAEHDRIAPRNRLFLDEQHLPAQTLDGRAISITAIADERSVEAALASGPDALYYTLPVSFDPTEIRHSLNSALDVMAGKPVLIPANRSLPLSPIVEAASRADITLALPAADAQFVPEPKAIELVLQEIDSAQSECAVHDVLFGMPRIALECELPLDDAWPSGESLTAELEGAAAAGATRLILSGALSASALKVIDDLTAIATVNLMPVTFYIGPSTLTEAMHADKVESGIERGVQLLIGAGVTGFLVTAGQTQHLKQIARSASYSDCRDYLIQWLSEQ